MTSLSMPSSVSLYTTEQITQIEQAYAHTSSQGTYPLMLRAGRAAFKLLSRRWPNARNILIVTGKGNNAGDGFVVAKLALEHRLKVTLCPLIEINQIAGDAQTAWQSIPQKTLQLVTADKVQFADYDLIIDAMLGTGIKGTLREPYHAVIKHINGNNVPVLAIDIPTGVEADTGYVHSEAVNATMTITFVGHKRGMYTGDSGHYRGEVQLDTLAIPEHFYQSQGFYLSAQDWHSSKHKLKPRSRIAHKGNFGHTLVIGGEEGMAGALLLASTSAAKSGSGLTSAWTSHSGVRALNQYCPEVMAQAVEQQQIESLLRQLLEKEYTLVIGPGLSQNSKAKQWISAIANHSKLNQAKQVWDADALNLLAEMDVSNASKYHSNRILTPHPGEAARLLGVTIETIASDRFAAAQQIATRYGGVCILKGAGTVISDEKGIQIVCAVGNPGMASGGMGDVLAGLVGGLLAQKFSLMDAAVLAVSIHGEAADRLAGPKQRYRGMLASDLFTYFAELLNP
jgi:ADP-dependent NAD(P)H-hydrate dehydratase / NAD(P)H-hydrate epimerase